MLLFNGAIIGNFPIFHIEQGEEELGKELIPYDSNESLQKRRMRNSSAASFTPHPNLGEVRRMGIYLVGETPARSYFLTYTAA